MILAKSLKIVKNSALHQVIEHQKIPLTYITFYFFNGHLISRTRGSSGHLEKITTVIIYTKKLLNSGLDTD